MWKKNYSAKLFINIFRRDAKITLYVWLKHLLWKAYWNVPPFKYLRYIFFQDKCFNHRYYKQKTHLQTRCVGMTRMFPLWILRRLANVSPFFNSLSNRLRKTNYCLRSVSSSLLKFTRIIQGNNMAKFQSPTAVSWPKIIQPE